MWFSWTRGRSSRRACRATCSTARRRSERSVSCGELSSPTRWKTSHRRRRRNGMKRLVIVIAHHRSCSCRARRLGRRRVRPRGGPDVAFAADQAKLPPLPADIKERKRWNIAVKCDTPPFGYIGASKPARRLRRRDRPLVLAVRVRQGEPCHVHLRDDSGPRARAHDRPRRHGDRDVHLQRRPRHADRLLAGLLQGDTGRLLVPNDSSIRSISRPRRARPSRRRPAPSTTAGSRTASRTRSSSSPTASRTR